MSLGTSNRDGGKTSESGHLRALGKIVSGDIITGLNAVQRAAGVNMSVDIQVGDAFVRRSDGTYSHPVFNDAVYNQVISAADGSNPRRDIVVIYVDYGETPSTGVSNNTNGVVKIKVVNGTPAGSPVDPNGAAIQASVGAGNPYSILARVRVPAGQTSISNSLIDDLRTTITNNPLTVNKASIVDGAVDASKLAAGIPVQIVSSNYNAVASGTTLIPFDDTMPQKTEGDEYMTLSFTPTSATNKLIIEIKAHMSSSAVNNMVGALFINTDTNAVAADEITIPTAGFSTTLIINYTMVAGTTSPITFRFRAGGSLAGTTTFNGEAGARKLGGVTLSTFKVTEYKL